MPELLVGLEEIAKFLRVPVSSLKQKSREMQRVGVLFQMWRGRPPKLMTCAFTDQLKAWLIALKEDLEKK